MGLAQAFGCEIARAHSRARVDPRSDTPAEVRRLQGSGRDLGDVHQRVHAGGDIGRVSPCSGSGADQGSIEVIERHHVADGGEGGEANPAS